LIRLFESYSTSYEELNIQECLQRQDFTEKGYYQKVCTEYLQNLYGTEQVILTASGTQALELAGMIVAQVASFDSIGNCERGKKKVGFSTYSFPSTINAFISELYDGVLMEIDEDGIIKQDYLEEYLQELFAIVVTNYAGMNRRIEQISEVCRRSGIILIEDNAGGFLSRENGKQLGSFGDLAVLSFQATKPVSCGEGGALIINNEKYWDIAQILAENGTTRRLHKQNIEISYTWEGKGTNCRLSEFNAAFLYGQFNHAYKDIEYRRFLINIYVHGLREIKGISIPEISNEWNAGMFYISCQDAELSGYLKEYLAKGNVEAMAHYGSLRESDYGRKMLYIGANEAKQFDKCMIRLPLHMKLTKEDVVAVCELIRVGVNDYRLNEFDENRLSAVGS